MGNYAVSPGISPQTIIPYGGKTEFLRRISWLDDKTAIPQIREVLFHTEDLVNRRDEPEGKNASHLKEECIKALGRLGAKSVLFEYLLQEKNLNHKYIQSTLAVLME
jgi:hypothetical protein